MPCLLGLSKTLFDRLPVGGGRDLKVMVQGRSPSHVEGMARKWQGIFQKRKYCSYSLTQSKKCLPTSALRYKYNKT